MNQETIDNLLSYYGELMYEHENTKDYFVKRKVLNKMNLINELLELPKVKGFNLREFINDKK